MDRIGMIELKKYGNDKGKYKYKAYQKSDKYKAYQKAYQKVYHKSNKYKAYQKAYQKSD